MAQQIALREVVVPSFEEKKATTAGRQESTTLPPQQHLLKRMWRKPLFMHYYRLAVAVLVGNVLALMSLTEGFQQSVLAISAQDLQNLILMNFALAIVVRFQPTINLFFKVATSAPTSWPLAIRWTLAKVYHFGGLHVGGFLAGSLLMYLFTAKTLIDGGHPALYSGVLIFHSVVLTVMMATALPRFRHKYHNTFEVIARFGSWISLYLFWVQFLYVSGISEAGFQGIYLQPQLYVLLGLTYCVVFPWLKLKKVKVNMVRPSKHVSISKFNYGVKPFAGSSTDLSRNPLFEWHSFANVPSPHEDGYRLTISRAGDWTGKYIDDAPEEVWVKGIPAAGVGNIEKCFKKVVWVATGSGIGPCLPHLLKGEVPGHLVWATRSPVKTYGKDLVGEVLSCDPNAIIWNTDEHGKPDMVELAYKALKDFDAEAVICISNKKLTWKVVEGLESRGIPAYGAIWDS